MERIFLAPSSANPYRAGRKVLNLLSKDRTVQVPWLYLGTDYNRMLIWEENLGNQFSRVFYAQEFQEIAKRWRIPYVEWIAQAGKSEPSLVWWSSRIAERNTYVYSLYHDICYLEIGRQIFAQRGGPLLVVAESMALLRTLAQQNEVRSSVRWLSRSAVRSEIVLWILRFIFVWTRDLLRGIRALYDARITRRGYLWQLPAPQGKRVLLHACIDEAYFHNGGRDRYFTVLPEELRKRGYEVVAIPWLFNLQRSRRKALAWFRVSASPYLIPEDYYRFSDYLWAAGVVAQQLRLLRGKQIFEGRDITTLVRAANRRGAVDTGIAVFVRYARLLARLKRAGVVFDIFLDKFENMLTEKPQVLALRTYFPEVRIVGFQHWMTPYFLQLHMMTTPEESRRAPYPDVIVCNAPLSASLFAEVGFPKEKLKVGPSLRYLYLLERQGNPRPESVIPSRAVLVILPLHPSLVAEMVHKLCLAFPDDEEIRFTLKVHPMMSRSRQIRALGENRLPSHMVTTQAEMADCIKGVECAVVSGSTAAVELLLMGIPVVTIGRETDFDLDPLAGFDSIKKPVYTPDELRAEVLRMLYNPQVKESVQEWRKRYSKDLLSPLTDATIKTFVQA